MTDHIHKPGNVLKRGARVTCPTFRKHFQISFLKGDLYLRQNSTADWSRGSNGPRGNGIVKELTLVIPMVTCFTDRYEWVTRTWFANKHWRRKSNTCKQTRLLDEYHIAYFQSSFWFDLLRFIDTYIHTYFQLTINFAFHLIDAVIYVWLCFQTNESNVGVANVDFIYGCDCPFP